MTAFAAVSDDAGEADAGEAAVDAKHAGRATAGTGWPDALRELRSAMVEHPLHLGLAGLVLGLLAPSLPVALVVTCTSTLIAAVGARRLALAVVLAVLVGAGIADMRLEHEARARAAWTPDMRLAGEATVLEVARHRLSGARSMRVRWHDGALSGTVLVARIERYVRWPDGVPIGARVRIEGRVDALTRTERYQARRDAAAMVFVARAWDTGRRRGGLAGALDRARVRAEQGLGSGLERPQAALARGLILGQDEAIDEDVREDFRRSGLAHVLAVSGQNVLLLAILVVAGAAVVGLRLRSRLVLAIALVAVYVPLAGGGPSIQRAGVMGAAGLVAALAGRPAARWYALGLAAASTLALNPRIAGEPGWQLSFAAVVGLLALARPLTDALARSRMPRPAVEAAAVTLVATLATAPLMAYHFGALSLVSLGANLVAASLIAPLMWLGMLAAAAGQLGTGAALPFTLAADPLLRALATLAHASASVPGAEAEVHIGSPTTLVAIYVAMAAACLGVARLARRRRAGEPRPALGRTGLRRLALGVAVIVAGGILLWPGGQGGRVAPPGRDELLISFLDIGQGNATLIQRNGATLLFDTGPDPGRLRTRLKEVGVERIDLLVLSHPALDHDGATEDLLRAGGTHAVVDGGAGGQGAHRRAITRALAGAHVRPQLPRAGEAIQFGDAVLKVLWPREEPGTPTAPVVDDANDAAVVLLLDWHGVRVLMPADAEGNVTARLPIPRIDVLAVAHHGSADADLPSLLRRTRPGVAVISVGRPNRYGHPAPSTLAALRSVPRMLRTDRDGSVHVRLRAPPGGGRAAISISATR